MTQASSSQARVVTSVADANMIETPPNDPTTDNRSIQLGSATPLRDEPTITQMEAADIETELNGLTNIDQDGLLNDQAMTLISDNDLQTDDAPANPPGVVDEKNTNFTKSNKVMTKRKNTHSNPKH